MRTVRINDTKRVSGVVTCGDMDPDYILTIPSALAFFQDGVASYLKSEYLGAFDLIKEGLIWVISDYTVNLGERLPIWLDKTITEIKVTEVTSMRIYFDFSIYGRDYKECVNGSSCWSLVDKASGRPVALDSVFTVVDNRKEDEPHIRHRKLTAPAIESPLSETCHLATFSDMDFNRHVGNRSYVSNTIYDIENGLDGNLYPSRLSVRFIRQSFVGDNLKYIYSKNVNGDYDVQIRRETGEEACHITMSWAPRTLPKPDICQSVTRD